VKLEFVGQPGPHRDIEAFVAAVKRARPDYSDKQVVETVRRGNATYKPRHRGSHWQLFGRDILTDDLQSLPAWPYIDAWWQKHLPLFPVNGGEMIAGETAAMTLQAAIDGYGVHRINRRSLLIPAGLSQSYVWTRANAWVQDVADADVAILRATPMINQCFRSAEQASGPVTARTYEFAEGERHRFRSFDDLEAFRKDDERKTQWTGV
jgi:hypothetical protein